MPRRPPDPLESKRAELAHFQRLLLQLAFAARVERQARQRRGISSPRGIPRSILKRGGIGDSDLKWLIAWGWVEQVPDHKTRQRRHRRRRNVVRFQEPHFAVTQTGLKLLEELAENMGLSFGGTADAASDPVVPRWDARRRELRYGGVLVKRFGRAAPNQERILTAFETQGWPNRIESPLPFPAEPGVSPKRRLRDALGRLNRSLTRPVICFRGDGTGLGIRWEALPSLADRMPTD